MQGDVYTLAFNFKTMNDDGYFEGFKRGDREVFNHLFDKYYSRIVLFSFRITKDQESSKDIAIESFQKLFLNREHVNDTDHIRQYLYVLSRNGSLNHLKKKKLVLKDVQDNSLSDDLRIAIEDNESLAEFFSIICILPERSQQVIVALFKDGLSYKEASEKLNISVKTIESQRSYALMLLRKMFRICQ